MNEPLIPVKYVFRRPRWVDRIYGTNLEFVTDQVRMLPESMALKFLRHTDTFVLGEPQPVEPTTPEQETAQALEKADAERKEREEQEQQMFALYDQLNVMDKPSIARFVREKFQIELPETLSIEDMRVEATTLIDRFGAT